MSIARRYRRWLVRDLELQVAQLLRETRDAKLLLARSLIEQRRGAGPVATLAQAEFKVFSQFGDDGIIQYLIQRLPPVERRFVEFGVGDYSEATTRFLLVNDNWRGLVMDSSVDDVERIRTDEIYAHHDLTAVAAHVTRENVNDLVTRNGFGGEIGLLHIDIDGNDYWVWEALEAARPAIAVIEYNAVFGPARAVTIPYRADFDRTRAHHSWLYFGASLLALDRLANRKGYRFVGCNSAGNNAYFIRPDLGEGLPRPSVEEGFVDSSFREARAPSGQLLFTRGDDRLRLIGDLPLVDIDQDRSITVADL